MKSLGLNSKKAGQLNICMKGDDVIQFDPKKMRIFLKLSILSWQGT